MPRGNGMGPNGKGPMTGRAAGFCAENETAGFLNPAGGRGMGCGLGRGRGGFGRRNMFHATGLTGQQRMAMAAGQVMPVSNKEQQLAALKAQAQSAEHVLADIRDQIAALEQGCS